MTLLMVVCLILAIAGGAFFVVGANQSAPKWNGIGGVLLACSLILLILEKIL